jgi:hypothetical protein
VDQLQKV